MASGGGETTPCGASAVLAGFASRLSSESIPPNVKKHAKLCILDGLGCALFGTTLPWGRIVDEFVSHMGGREEATLWGTGGRVPAANAALVNGTLIHSFELDDLHQVSILHPTSVVLPAVFAIAEMDPSMSGTELLTAVVAGYEVGARVGMSVGTSQLLRGFHPTGTLGGIAAAAAAGRALRLSPEQMAHGISIGATQGAGLMAAQFDSMVKRMHAGRAAQSGVYGALLARKGFIGIDRVLEEPYGGFCATIGEEPDLDALTRNLGETFETLSIGFKSYACCGSCHTSVEAAKRLREDNGLSPVDVERIEVETTRATLLHVGWPYEPASATRAQMNLPYCVAVTLADGDAFIDQFTQARIRDPELVALAGRVEVRNDPALDALGPQGRHTVRMKVTCRDGRVLKQIQHHSKGSPAAPLSRDEVIEKFHRLASIAIGEDDARAVFDAVINLEERFMAANWAQLLGRARPQTVALTTESTRNA